MCEINFDLACCPCNPAFFDNIDLHGSCSRLSVDGMAIFRVTEPKSETRNCDEIAILDDMEISIGDYDIYVKDAIYNPFVMEVSVPWKVIYSGMIEENKSTTKKE